MRNSNITPSRDLQASVDVLQERADAVRQWLAEVMEMHGSDRDMWGYIIVFKVL